LAGPGWRGGTARGTFLLPMTTPVLPPVRSVFRAVATTVVPDAGQLTEAEWSALERIVEQVLARRPQRVRRQISALIRIIDTSALFATGQRFTTLDEAGRLRFLDRLSRAPLLLLRRGVWGLRTLVLMGYYARPEAGAAIGYRADKRGWDARR
jgi:hypothetical protein